MLFKRNGWVTEFSRSNIFVFRKNELITPDKDILEGITRRTVLELARDRFPVEIRPLSLQEVYEADEVFTTSSNKGVMPIREVDDKFIGVGKNTQLLMQTLESLQTIGNNWDSTIVLFLRCFKQVFSAQLRITNILGKSSTALVVGS